MCSLREKRVPVSVSQNLALCLFIQAVFTFLAKNYLSAHTLGCKIKECKQNAHYQGPLDGLLSYPQLPLILARVFQLRKDTVICIWLHTFPSPTSTVLLEQDQGNRERIFLLDDTRWPIKKKVVLTIRSQPSNVVFILILINFEMLLPVSSCTQLKKWNNKEGVVYFSYM